MFPDPVPEQTRKQTVIEIQKCFVHRPCQPNELKEATEESPDTKTGVRRATESWTKMAGTTQQPEERETGSASSYQGKCNSTNQKTDAAKGRLWEPWV